jgi:hypothetical protein
VLKVLRKKGDIHLLYYANKKGYKLTWVKFHFYMNHTYFNNLLSQFYTELNNDLKKKCITLQQTNKDYKAIFEQMKKDKNTFRSLEFHKLYNYMIKKYF